MFSFRNNALSLSLSLSLITVDWRIRCALKSQAKLALFRTRHGIRSVRTWEVKTTSPAAVSTPWILPKDVGIVIRLFRILPLSRRVANYDDVISLSVTSLTMLFTSTKLSRMTAGR